jgi:hypothetical protein
VAERSKVQDCGRSPGEIVGSYPTASMYVCLLLVLCVVKYRSLRRADHSSRRVLPSVVRVERSRNLVNEEDLTNRGLAVVPNKKIA